MSVTDLLGWLFLGAIGVLVGLFVVGAVQDRLYQRRLAAARMASAAPPAPVDPLAEILERDRAYMADWERRFAERHGGAAASPSWPNYPRNPDGSYLWIGSAALADPPPPPDPHERSPFVQIDWR